MEADPLLLLLLLLLLLVVHNFGTYNACTADSGVDQTTRYDRSGGWRTLVATIRTVGGSTPRLIFYVIQIWTIDRQALWKGRTGTQFILCLFSYAIASFGYVRRRVEMWNTHAVCVLKLVGNGYY